MLVIHYTYFLSSTKEFLLKSGHSHDTVHVLSTGRFEDPTLYTSWLPPEDAFHLWKTEIPINKYEKSATLVSNSQALLGPLDNMVAKAWNMFASR